MQWSSFFSSGNGEQIKTMQQWNIQDIDCNDTAMNKWTQIWCRQMWPCHCDTHTHTNTKHQTFNTKKIKKKCFCHSNQLPFNCCWPILQFCVLCLIQEKKLNVRTVTCHLHHQHPSPNHHQCLTTFVCSV